MQDITIGRSVHYHASPGDSKPEHAVVIDVPSPGSDVVTLKKTNHQGTDSTLSSISYGGLDSSGWRWPPKVPFVVKDNVAT